MIPRTAESLLAAVGSGNREAFRSLYQLAAPRLYAICLRMSRSREVADDCLQDVFFRVWQKAHTFDPANNGYGWLVRASLRTLADHHARRLVVQRPQGLGLRLHLGQVLGELGPQSLNIHQTGQGDQHLYRTGDPGEQLSDRKSTRLNSSHRT